MGIEVWTCLELSFEDEGSWFGGGRGGRKMGGGDRMGGRRVQVCSSFEGVVDSIDVVVQSESSLIELDSLSELTRRLLVGGSGVDLESRRRGGELMLERGRWKVGLLRRWGEGVWKMGGVGGW